MKIGIFTGGTSVRSKNIFTDISRYPTGKHEIKFTCNKYNLFTAEPRESPNFLSSTCGTFIYLPLGDTFFDILCNRFVFEIRNHLNIKTLLHRNVLTHQQQSVFENIVEKGEIARYEQFVLFPQCFLFKQITVSPFVHIFAIVSLFAAELEEPRI